jgi:DNA-binding CsgD family transcriptional regulator
VSSHQEELEGTSVVSLRPAPRAARAPGSSEGPQTPAEGTAIVPAEMLVDGRRYRLVPVDGPADDGRPSVAAERRPSAAEQLTARELQIATLVAEGFVNKQIAGELRISEYTVSTHLRRIYAKLGVDTRAAMVSRCSTILRRR